MIKTWKLINNLSLSFFLVVVEVVLKEVRLKYPQIFKNQRNPCLESDNSTLKSSKH